MRVFFSTPIPLGSVGVGATALEQVRAAADHGAEVVVCTTGVDPRAEIPPGVRIVRSLGLGRWRVPHRALGLERAFRWNDYIGTKLLRRRGPGGFDLVHCWPGWAQGTLTAAAELGIPSLREAPSAHTAEALAQAAAEESIVNIPLAARDPFRNDPAKIRREEIDYRLAGAVLTPSAYVAATFARRGHPESRLIRHRYGYNPERFPPPEPPQAAPGRPFTALFVGLCQPLKGVHYLLEAWYHSGAYRRGRLRLVGGWVPGYREALAELLAHPSIEVLPFSPEVAAHMREADAFVLPSVTEGSAIVTFEAQAMGLALLVSDATGADMAHGVQGFEHPARDVQALAGHLATCLDQPELLLRMRRAGFERRDTLSWRQAGRRLAEIYRAVAGRG